MAYGKNPVERALLLGVVSGLKATLGPALISAARDRPERKMLAMAAMGEMVIDKLPFVPSRSRLPLLLPRAFAGYWSAKQSLERDGVEEGSTAYTAAAVSAGVAVFAPMIRGTLRRVLGVPDALLGAAEDYLALKIGGEAVGLSMSDLKQIGETSFSDIREQVTPLIEEAKHRLEPSRS